MRAIGWDKALRSEMLASLSLSMALCATLASVCVADDRVAGLQKVDSCFIQWYRLTWGNTCCKLGFTACLGETLNN